MLSLLIPRPQSPRNDIDVYLQPLIEELKELWEFGVETYDASNDQTFQLWTSLLWTISDYPGYAMLSGWSTKGKLACVCCNYNTNSTYLRHNHKMCYMDHRVFLPASHAWRESKRLFKGKKEHRSAPPMLKGKTKDHVNARYDLQDMGIRKELHPIEIGGGQTKFAKASFSMNSQEKSTFCSVLKTANVPDGSASNISKCVHVGDKKIFAYKSHDAHFMLHYLLQVAIKSTMPNLVAGPLIRLGSFFRSLCQKVIQVQDLYYLNGEIAEILCQLEMVFPPSFFDVMVHLSIHLVYEVRLGGPVQFRWMYPTERNLCRLKTYVRNRAHPEGSTAGGYLAEEALTLWSRYLHKSVNTRLNRMSRNYDNNDSCEVDSNDYFSSIGRHLGGKQNDKLFSIDSTSKAQAHRYILFNCDDIQTYIREYDECVSSHTKGGRWIKAKRQGQDFSEWFKIRALENDVSIHLKALSRGPNVVAKRFSDTTQNSGVTLVSLTESFASSKDENPKTDHVTYYGAINDIIELDYYSQLKFVLFKCDWFEAKEDKYGLTCVHFNKKYYQNDPFVLVSQVHQCFYVQDPFDENKHYVMKIVPRDLFNMGDQSNATAQEEYLDDPFYDIGNINASNNENDLNWVREDIPATIVEKLVDVIKEFEEEDDYDLDDE
ncbi:uncharacterized protein [Cicer arietinum]|uniref:Uncharacterized protein LOC101510134 n=1 Tax=Cicer arietinum TaxID=3827 RepID=A0A1S2Z4C2_CICAR|nr:uncharacterized protein LOC101510134 [Cicer arietinum]